MPAKRRPSKLITKKQATVAPEESVQSSVLSGKNIECLGNELLKISKSDNIEKVQKYLKHDDIDLFVNRTDPVSMIRCLICSCNVCMILVVSVDALNVCLSCGK